MLYPTAIGYRIVQYPTSLRYHTMRYPTTIGYCTIKGEIVTFTMFFHVRTILGKLRTFH